MNHDDLRNDPRTIPEMLGRSIDPPLTEDFDQIREIAHAAAEGVHEAVSRAITLGVEAATEHFLNCHPELGQEFSERVTNLMRWRIHEKLANINNIAADGWRRTTYPS